MLSEQQIRLELNDLHTCITDVLECIDEQAYTDAESTLDHMQSDINCLRKEVADLLSVRERTSRRRGRRWTGVSGDRATSLN